MGCSQAKARQSISLKLIQLKSAQNEAMIEQNLQKDNTKFNITRNPIIKRRAQKKNKMSQTTVCTPTMIS
ncbi:unnamed protein product (macronuclear) [Paramecium tetraurelia]|uniref:Uncharacterized protein n=1 Tax=Paramecium tetraurelia TaxID=5888 RepID=A0BRY7_PARTE|nr:uncharacterized protein GSPATT00031535001 [Paramecium tetraurelia]CAK61304.1 unnamed protein product [Paramecium tetraurelia]|eukprot:XP_001428702.1 hypothetical protein (macronuclear) [Paramecium tetraurelia strain d4-2]